MKSLFSSKTLSSLGLGAIVAVLAAVPAQAAPPTKGEEVDTSMCSEPTVEQPFLYANDANYYRLMPGEEPDNFEGTEGWELKGGARIVTTTLADGSTGQVLDLPSGSEAVSPTICVTKHYPTAKTLVHNVKGAEGVFTYVSYQGTNTWEKPKNTGQVHGKGSEWTLSDPINLQPNNTANWQRLRMTLIGGGKTSEFQIYNLYIDPRLSH